jgi:hypothetical protein
MMAEEVQQSMFTVAGKGLVKINTDNRVDGRLKTNGKYIMHLPETEEVLYLVCGYIAIRAADMTIVKHIKKGKPVTSDLNCTFGYQFEHFNAVCFSSWNYREKCDLYAIEDIYVMHDSLDALFVEDVKVEVVDF